MVSVPYPETVAVVPTRRTSHGDREPIPDADYTVAGCIVWPQAAGGVASFAEQTWQADTVIVGFVCLFPPGTPVSYTDRVVLRGQVYEVVGEPAAWRSPFTGTDVGVQVSLSRAT